MEVFEFEYGWDLIKARIGKSGSVYIDMPIRWGTRGSEFRESIVLEDRGWRFTSTQDDCIDYYFHMWLKDNGILSWANDMTRGIQYMDEPFNPDRPNAGVLNDTAIMLYNISQEVKNYQKRNLPTHEIFELRKLYLNVALKMLGYDSIDAVGEKLDNSRGYFGLTRVVDGLEKYIDLSRLVYSLGKAGDEDLLKCNAAKDATREQILEYAKPVKEQIDEYVEFMQTRASELKEKRLIFPEYKMRMKEKAGEYSWDEYEEKVKMVAILLLELNADLLTEEQRTKFGIAPFKVQEDILIKDKISNLIDSREFNEASRIEDEFAYEESEELVRRMRALKPEDSPLQSGFSREDIVRLLSSELKDLEERKSSVDIQETIRKKYYSRKDKKQAVKVLDDEILDNVK
ncbi:MAG: hypothetical protein IJW20_01350 [Clostridia bacterium]|nr:hypothetical protein [Clostridia bacterium]